MAGNKRWPHSTWDNDGGAESWSSEECKEIVIRESVNTWVRSQGHDERDNPGVDQVSDEVGVLSLFDEYLSFINV